MPPHLIVVGSSNTDLIVRAERLPAPGETVLGGEFITAAGGKGANQAVAAARLGARVAFVARVGADTYGRDSLANFTREGMDTRYVVTDPQAPSGVALIVVGSNGQNLIAVAPGANARLTPADVEAARPAFAEARGGDDAAGRIASRFSDAPVARVLLLQLETPLETVLAAARLGRAHGLTVILNPAPAQLLPAELYPLVDVFTPNEHEAETLTGEREPEAAARALLARGVKTVIITLGEAGVSLATASSTERFLGFRVEVVDTTAAGDAFNGGLAVALTRNEPLPAAIRYAQAAAALSVTKFGAQPSLPSIAEVNDFLARH